METESGEVERGFAGSHVINLDASTDSEYHPIPSNTVI